MKSMTKDGGIVAQSFVVGRGIPRADVTTAAAIRMENSRVRLGCGQPANPRSTPAPIAMAATRTTPERRGSVRIQATSERSSTNGFTGPATATPGPPLRRGHNSLLERVLDAIRQNRRPPARVPIRHARSQERVPGNLSHVRAVASRPAPPPIDPTFTIRQHLRSDWNKP
jgi:hypothetical protein